MYSPVCFNIKWFVMTRLVYVCVFCVIFNPRQTCTRGIVVCLCECVCICLLPPSGYLSFSGACHSDPGHFLITEDTLWFLTQSTLGSSEHHMYIPYSIQLQCLPPTRYMKARDFRWPLPSIANLLCGCLYEAFWWWRSLLCTWCSFEKKRV